MLGRTWVISIAVAALVAAGSAHAGVIQFAPDDYGIFGGESVTVGSNTRIIGTVGAGIDVLVYSGAEITGDIRAIDDVKLMASSIVTGRTIAGDWVEVGNDATTGRIDAGGGSGKSRYISVGNGAHTGELRAAKSISVLQSGVVSGNIHAGVDATVHNNASVSGAIYAGDDVDLKAGSSAGAVHAADRVHMDNGSTAASVTAGNDVELKASSTVNGDVNAGDDFEIKNGAVVYGDVTYKDKKTIKNGAVIHGTLTKGTPDAPTAPEDPDSVVVALRDNPGFSYGSQSLSYAHNQDITLAAGDYKDLTVGDETILRLSAGTYRFRGVLFEDDVQIIADTSAGDVIIDVQDDFYAGPGALFSRVGQGKLVLRAQDQLSIGGNSNLVAHLLSYDDITLGSGTSVAGLLYAQEDVNLGNDVTVTHNTSSGGAHVPEPGAIVLLGIGGAIMIARRQRRRLAV